jgi:chromosome segregation ATPase
MRPSLPAALMTLLCLSVWTLPSHAASGSAAEYCKQHPEACAAAARGLQERCAADPAACERAHERVEDLKDRCADNPAACEAKKQELRERADKLRERCAANPDECQAQTDKLRERLQDRRKRMSPAGETPPTIPPKPDR